MTGTRREIKTNRAQFKLDFYIIFQTQFKVSLWKASNQVLCAFQLYQNMEITPIGARQWSLAFKHHPPAQTSNNMKQKVIISKILFSIFFGQMPLKTLKCRCQKVAYCYHLSGVYLASDSVIATIVMKTSERGQQILGYHPPVFRLERRSIT